MTQPFKNIFKSRHRTGSRKKAYQKRGRVRGLITRPEQLLELIRDIYPNSPVPSDALFNMVGIDSRLNQIYFHFGSLVSPTINCITLQPELLLDMMKTASRGFIPKDATLEAICVHDNFTYLRFDVRSDKFPASDKDVMPLLQFRYEDKEFFLLDQEKKPEERVDRFFSDDAEPYRNRLV